MCLCWPQVSCWLEDVHPQWNEGQLGQGESREANEAQRAWDMGTAGQSGGQQGRHLGEAHRSAEHIHTGTLTFQQVFERTDFTVYTRSCYTWRYFFLCVKSIVSIYFNDAGVYFIIDRWSWIRSQELTQVASWRFLCQVWIDELEVFRLWSDHSEWTLKPNVNRCLDIQRFT